MKEEVPRVLRNTGWKSLNVSSNKIASYTILEKLLNHSCLNYLKIEILIILWNQ